MDYGQHLKQELSSRGLRYNFVGESVGIPPKQLNKYLNGHQKMPKVKLMAVCLYFGIPLKKFGINEYLCIRSDIESLPTASIQQDAPRGNVLGKDDKRLDRDKELENLEKGRKS